MVLKSYGIKIKTKNKKMETKFFNLRMFDLFKIGIEKDDAVFVKISNKENEIEYNSVEYNPLEESLIRWKYGSVINNFEDANDFGRTYLKIAQNADVIKVGSLTKNES